MRFTSLKELVHFFHHALGLPDLSTMISMTISSSFSSWPSELTPSVIRNRFPVCIDCPLGNLAERSLPSQHLTSPLIFECTVWEALKLIWKGKYSAPDDKPVRSFDGSLYTFKDVDLASDYAYSSRTGLLLYNIRLRNFIHARGKKWKYYVQITNFWQKLFVRGVLQIK